MNRGLLNKSAREAFGVTLLCAGGLLIFEAMVAYVFWTYQKELTDELLQIEFLQDFICGLDFITFNFLASLS